MPQNPSTQNEQIKSTKNVWQERAAARKVNKKQPTTPSFAEVVKGTNNSSLDAKEVMNQIAQMMSNWNANGLKTNLEELKDCIIDYNPDVIGIQETHLRPADRVSIPNYTCHRSDRTTHRGGGTALFVKNSIRHHAILNVSNTFENSSIILQLGETTVRLLWRVFIDLQTAPLILRNSTQFSSIATKPFFSAILMPDIPAGTQAGQTQMEIFCAIGPLGRHWIFLPPILLHTSTVDTPTLSLT
ncbi:putative RNA-directed DNA polymerase from transposon X-element [Trichonephila clavipes]|nr:putative RNA-directed DNA polymerase from transposon X-element [Trichonephila clavipes]